METVILTPIRDEVDPTEKLRSELEQAFGDFFRNPPPDYRIDPDIFGPDRGNEIPAEWFAIDDPHPPRSNV